VLAVTDIFKGENMAAGNKQEVLNHLWQNRVPVGANTPILFAQEDDGTAKLGAVGMFMATYYAIVFLPDRLILQPLTRRRNIDTQTAPVVLDPRAVRFAMKRLPTGAAYSLTITQQNGSSMKFTVSNMPGRTGFDSAETVKAQLGIADW
jgi:hypothetical protein